MRKTSSLRRLMDNKLIAQDCTTRPEYSFQHPVFRFYFQKLHPDTPCNVSIQKKHTCTAFLLRHSPHKKTVLCVAPQVLNNSY